MQSFTLMRIARFLCASLGLSVLGPNSVANGADQTTSVVAQLPLPRIAGTIIAGTQQIQSVLVGGNVADPVNTILGSGQPAIIVAVQAVITLQNGAVVTTTVTTISSGNAAVQPTIISSVPSGTAIGPIESSTTSSVPFQNNTSQCVTLTTTSFVQDSPIVVDSIVSLTTTYSQTSVTDILAIVTSTSTSTTSVTSFASPTSTGTPTSMVTISTTSTVISDLVPPLSTETVTTTTTSTVTGMVVTVQARYVRTAAEISLYAGNSYIASAGETVLSTFSTTCADVHLETTFQASTRTVCGNVAFRGCDNSLSELPATCYSLGPVTMLPNMKRQLNNPCTRTSTVYSTLPRSTIFRPTSTTQATLVVATSYSTSTSTQDIVSTATVVVFSYLTTQTTIGETKTVILTATSTQVLPQLVTTTTTISTSLTSTTSSIITTITSTTLSPAPAATCHGTVSESGNNRFDQTCGSLTDRGFKRTVLDTFINGSPFCQGVCQSDPTCNTYVYRNEGAGICYTSPSPGPITLADGCPAGTTSISYEAVGARNPTCSNGRDVLT